MKKGTNMQMKASWFYSKVGIATLLLALMTIICVTSAWAQKNEEPSVFAKANTAIIDSSFLCKSQAKILGYNGLQTTTSSLAG